MKRFIYSALFLSFTIFISCSEDSRKVKNNHELNAEIVLPAKISYWNTFQAHCGKAYEGSLTKAPEGDTMIVKKDKLIAHFRMCGPEEMKIAFHIFKQSTQTWNRSRTWVLMKKGDQLELRHDHRHEDGTKDEFTWYGGSTEDDGDVVKQEYIYRDKTFDDDIMRGWRLEIERDNRYTYGTIRNGEWNWRIDFDLSKEIQIPPNAWGHDD
jgi:hypothetical protein